jgi:hypothetical protein
MASIAHRAIAAALALLALFAWAFGPLLSLVLFAMAIAVVLDRRGVFGWGRYRAMVAFLSSLWLGLAGVAATIVGLLGEATGFLLAPGVVVLGTALALLAWSSVAIWRTRRGTWAELDG